MADTPRVLLICSTSKAHHDLTKVFQQQGIRSTSAFTVSDAEPLLHKQLPALVICASELLDGTFRDILRNLQQARLNIPVLVICRSEDPDRAEYNEAIHLGAIDCLQRPLDVAGIEAITQRVMQYLS